MKLEKFLEEMKKEGDKKNESYFLNNFMDYLESNGFVYEDEAGRYKFYKVLEENSKKITVSFSSEMVECILEEKIGNTSISTIRILNSCIPEKLQETFEDLLDDLAS